MFVSSFCIPKIHSQANNTEAALFNIGIASVFSGIGAIINKNPEQKLGKVLLKGMAQGALGGYVVYQSKTLVREIAKQEKYGISWGAKLVNSAGSSIIENAASNRNFWEKWHINIGFNRIEFYTQHKFRVKYKLMPSAFFFTMINAAGRKFEWEKSLKTGQIIFSETNLTDKRTGRSLAGMELGTSIVLDTDHLKDYSVFAHETIHVYQNHDFNVFNTYINKPLAEFRLGSGFFRFLDKFMYIDFNIIPNAALYTAEDFNIEASEKYQKNYFEHEADFYSITSD